MNEVEIRILQPHEAAFLDCVAPDLFDYPLDPCWTGEFFADPHHHLAVALDGTLVVGFASGVRVVHPDKAPELFVNELAVAPTHRRHGLGRALVRCLLDHARALGCVGAWVLTSPTNEPARRTYATAGGEEADEHPTMFEFGLNER